MAQVESRFLNFVDTVILAYSRTTTFFYAYYLLRTLTAMICEGSINCLALAYVADNVLERQRTSAFGILSGIATAAFVCGTLAARFLSTASTFQVAALVSMLAAVYMRIFLRERLAPVLKKIPSIQDITGLLKSSVTFSQAAVVAFFNSIAEGGMQASIMYYLKARFHFSKNQYADLMLLLGIAGMASQLVFMPLLAQLVAEEKLLAIGLLGGIADALLFSVAWSNWVPYATTIFAVFVVFVPPCLRSIASKQVGPTEQGKAQGCISGIISFAKIVSPLIYSPSDSFIPVRRCTISFPWLQYFVHWICDDDCILSECSHEGCSSYFKSQNQQQLTSLDLVLIEMNNLSIICIVDTSIRLQAPFRNLFATAFSYDGRVDSNEKNLLQSQRSTTVFNYL
ncbi:hypothetical protein OIU76_030201 [Salix suchowensis]|nr:hypothetical protein OIU76_030201 [Salix suchowensis]